MNNLKHVWSILCANSSVDQKTNTISLFNVLEQINIEKKALNVAKGAQKNLVATINFQLVSLWKKEVEQKKFKIEQKVEVVDSYGKILASASMPLEVPEAQKRMRVINNFNGLPISTTGEYLFKIFFKEEASGKFIEQAAVPLVVKEKD